MRLLVSIIDGLAVEIEVSGHHCLGRAVRNGVPVNVVSVEFQCGGNLIGHCVDVVGRDESAAAR
jgi:hypothetical protein